MADTKLVIFNAVSGAGGLAATDAIYMVRPGAPDLDFKFNPDDIVTFTDDNLLARIAGSTFSTIQDYANFAISPGRSSGGDITVSGTANAVDVAAGTGFIKATDSNTAELLFFDWPASVAVSVPVDTIRFIGVEYNAGSPQVITKATDTWDLDTEFPLGAVANESGTRFIINDPWITTDNTANVIERFDSLGAIARDNRLGGLIISNVGTRNIAVSVGALFARMSEFPISAIDTSASDIFDNYFRDGSGGFTKQSAQTQWNNTQFDDGSGTLANLTAGFFTSRWFYLMTDGTLAMLYGQEDFPTLGDALNEGTPTTVPDRILISGLIIGCIIAQEGTDTPAAVRTVFEATFSSSSVTDFDDLSGFAKPSQGGTGIINNDASTLTISGNFATTMTVTGATAITLPVSGTLATLSDLTPLVAEADFNAFTILAADVDDTPTALTVGVSTFIGRKSTGGIVAMSTAEAKTELDLTGTNTGDQTITLTSDVTGSGTGSFSTTIATSAVTLAKMADVATSTVFYRKTAATGAPEVQTLATLKTDLGLTGTNTGDQTITLTGDVTGSGTGSFSTTIANGAVDIVMLSATGTPDGTTFLRGDNTWATPAGGGDMLLGTIQTVTAAKTFDSGTMIFAGATSGTTILNADAAAGTTTITMPPTSGVMALTSDITGLVAEADFNAFTILAADVDDTPTPLTVGASTFVGRLSTGGIVAMTPSQLLTEINVTAGATPNEFAFKTISVATQTDVVADADADTLTLVAGTNISITTSGDTITFSETSGTPIFTETFISSDMAITAAGQLTLAHSLSTIPIFIIFQLINVTAELGYTTGQTTYPAFVQAAGSNKGLSVIPDATNLVLRFGSSGTTFIVVNATTGATSTVTNANWEIRLSAFV